jgi:hypothetical protein
MKKPACYNHPPFKEKLVVQNGYYEREERGAPVRIPKYEYVDHVMTKSCQWSILNNSPACKGCKWKAKGK